MAKRTQSPVFPVVSEDARALLAQILQTWRINHEITLALLGAISKKGLAAIPPDTRGKTVAEQFMHLQRVRFGWLRVNNHPGWKALNRFSGHRKGAAIPAAELIAAFRQSGPMVEEYLRERIAHGRRIMFFRGRPVRWLAYMIAHESHHRGAIALTLKLNGMPLPSKVALTEVWMKWYYG